MKKPFIKVKLHSDVGGRELGQKDLVVYYKCGPNTINVTDSDILIYDDALLEWINTNDNFQKGDANKDFEYSSPDTLQVVHLNEDEIKRVKEAGYLVCKEDLEKML